AFRAILTPVASRSISWAAEAVPVAASAETSTAAAMAIRRTCQRSARSVPCDIPHTREALSEARGRSRMTCVRTALDDLRELRDGVPELVLGVVEVRAEADSGVRPKVADDPALAQLAVDGCVVGGADEDRAASPACLARARDLEARGIERVDQELRQRQRAFPSPVDADLLDHVVPGGRCVE